jgi:predicted transglutaminase-like cysteine proteinase
MNRFVNILLFMLYAVLNTANAADIKTSKFYDVYKSEVAGYSGKAVITKINQFINSFPYKDDVFTYNTENHWASPSEYIKNKGGDCEDSAMMKALLLKKQGVKTVYVRFNKRNTNHVALVAIAENRLWLLDDKKPYVITKQLAKKLKLQFFKVKGHHLKEKIFSHIPTIALVGGEPTSLSGNSVQIATAMDY